MDDTEPVVAKWLADNELIPSGAMRMEYLTEAREPAEMLVRVIIPVSSAGAPQLADVAFIAGEWHGAAGDSRLTERWSVPVGDSMLGALQWVRPDGIWMYELMCIQQRSNGVLFQLRHFDRDMKPWEETPLRMMLTEADAGRAVFTNLDADGDVGRLVFERSDDQLQITLVPREGVEESDRTFVFTLAGP